MSSNPFAPASDRGDSPVDRSLVQVALIAAPITAGFATAKALITPWALDVPAFPPVTVLVAVGLGAIGALATVWNQPRAVLFAACLALPIALWTVDLSAQRQLGPIAMSIDLMAFEAVWASTLGGLASAAWLGVPPRRWLGFLAAAGLKSQALLLGWQLLLPGLTAFVVLALLEVVAARDEPGSWVMGSLRAMSRSPAAWGMVVGGHMLAYGLSVAVPFAWGADAGWAAILDPAYPSAAMRLAMGIPSALIAGASLALAAARLSPVGR